MLNTILGGVFVIWELSVMVLTPAFLLCAAIAWIVVLARRGRCPQAVTGAVVDLLLALFWASLYLPLFLGVDARWFLRLVQAIPIAERLMGSVFFVMAPIALVLNGALWWSYRGRKRAAASPAGLATGSADSSVAPQS